MSTDISPKRPVGFFVPRKQLMAMALSLCMLLAAMFLVWMGHWLPALTEQRVEVREISVLLPPPPPPPVPQQAAIEAPLSLQVEGTGPSIEMVDVRPEVEVIQPDLPAVDTRQVRWQPLEIDWNAFDLNALDGLPTLLTQLRVSIPRSLSSRGVASVLVKLDIVIDEAGQVTLIEIVENPYPVLEPEIQRMVRSTRFSPPKKDGQPVRARFIWPVEIKS